MRFHRYQLLVCFMTAVGCGGGSPAPNNVNPYANNQAPQNSAPLPSPVPRRPSPASGGGESKTSSPAASQTFVVPEAGFAAEMGVPLSFLEYAKFARQSSEMLAEMAKIHAEVSESGDAEAHQQRWGELTAAHSALIRRVVESAYPPAELARELKPNALSRLDREITFAAAVMENYDDLEGGLAQPYAQAKRIFEHLAKNLTEEERTAMPAANDK